MKCTVCDNECDVYQHSYVVGIGPKYSKEWSIEAPKYYKASSDYKSIEYPYCSPQCSSDHYIKLKNII